LTQDAGKKQYSGIKQDAGIQESGIQGQGSGVK